MTDPRLHEILTKLGIDKLNAMQTATLEALETANELVLLSPTGSGKTLAFLLPVFFGLRRDVDGVQALILTPSRELAGQIEQVARKMATGFKVNAVYGGRASSHDKIDLKHPPAVLIGTPGRVADHLRNQRFGTDVLRFLVLDEFDKSLEIGFESDMRAILGELRKVEVKILTSATYGVEIPDFIDLKKPFYIDHSERGPEKLQIKVVESSANDPREDLVRLLAQPDVLPAIVFVNFRDSVELLGDFLFQRGVDYAVFYGTMEQQDRERSLVKFRNGSCRVLVATDLAARGIDVPEVQSIIHFELPMKEEEFIHRNGRTARMHRSGVAYVLHPRKRRLPAFIAAMDLPRTAADSFAEAVPPASQQWQTVLVSAGRRDKISKGDLAGFFIKVGGLQPDEVGAIEVRPECAFVAVSADRVKALLPKLDNQKLKTKKVRVRRV
jgi:superfamily II DNA/RNA helicase